MKPILEINRQILREMSLADLDFGAAMLAHLDVMHYWSSGCYNREESSNWIVRQQNRYDSDGIGY